MKKKDNPLEPITRRPHGWVYIRKFKTKPDQTGFWAMNKKLEACTTYLSTGNLMLTSKLTTVPYETLKMWRNSEWWKEATDKYYEEENISIDTRLSKILDKSINAINDRIENGDFTFDQRTGTIRRVPVKLRDVHKVSSDIIDRQQVLRKKRVETVADNTTTNDKLKKLAEAFTSFVASSKKEKVIEGDYIVEEGEPSSPT